MFNALYGALGPQHWWPGDGMVEISLGAILTQNTAWANVERALGNLKTEVSLSGDDRRVLRRLKAMPRASLERLLRPSGFFREKTHRVKEFARHALEQGGLKEWFRAPTRRLRDALLSVHGIGPETADSILLYAARRPVFVVDSYTRRILSRHGFPVQKMNYEELRGFAETRLSRSERLYNEFHALLVQVGKKWCRTSFARCSECPLRVFRPVTLEKGVCAA